MHRDNSIPSIRLRRAFLACAAVALTIAVSVTTPTAFAGTMELQVTKSWARATTPSAKTGAAYVTLANMSTKSERLVAISSSAARKIEIHTHVMKDNMMSMRRLDDLVIEPGGIKTMKPGGTHLMMMGLTGPLVKGQILNLTLQFKSGLTREVEAMIYKVGSRGPVHSQGNHANDDGHKMEDGQKHHGGDGHK